MKPSDPFAERYLELLKKSLLNELYLENEARILYFVDHIFKNNIPPINQAISQFLNIKDSETFHHLKSSRQDGSWLPYGGVNNTGRPDEVLARNFSFVAHTMIGKARLNNIHYCLDVITRDKIPGDLIETGVWKGGATIFMRGYLAAHNIKDRKVWLADSFEGLPVPTHENDQGWDLSKNAFPYLSVGQEEVKELFARYDLLDDQVCFLKGWFNETLPTAPIEKLALLRLDGDLYESTIDALNNLYPKLSTGGFVIIDDYNALPQCEKAVHDYRDSHEIEDEIFRIDGVSVFWRKTEDVFSSTNMPYSLLSLIKYLIKRN